MTKTCTSCGKDFPASTEYFYKEKAGKFGLRSKCKQCMNISTVKNKREKSDYYNQKARERRAANPEKYRERDRKYNQTPKRKAYARQHAIDNRDRKNQTRNEWLHRTGNIKIYNHNRRAALLAGGTYTQEEWEDLVAFWENKCIKCGIVLPTNKMTPDHVIPLKLGGLNIIDNIQPMCKSCNCSKQKKTTDYRVCEIKAEKV